VCNGRCRASEAQGCEFFHPLLQQLSGNTPQCRGLCETEIEEALMLPFRSAENKHVVLNSQIIQRQRSLFRLNHRIRRL
jgi:hypothetical protein